MNAAIHQAGIYIMLICASGYGAYLDAEGGSAGNTVRASDGDVNAWWTTATAQDGLWGRRTGFSNNPNGELGTPDNDIFEASGTGSGVEDAVLIKTVIAGLVPGSTYKVDVVYWSSTTQNWAVRAGFNASTSSYYDRLGADGAAAGTPTGKTEGDRAEYRGSLGQTQADANGRIEVFINDKPAVGPSEGWYDRTWYDGLFYEKVDTGCNGVLLYDFTGPGGEPDCIVNLYDFAELASHWLECSLIPESACDD